MLLTKAKNFDTIYGSRNRQFFADVNMLRLNVKSIKFFIGRVKRLIRLYKITEQASLDAVHSLNTNGTYFEVET